MSLYDDIGKDFIERALTAFYDRAFKDGIIGHFFFGKDQADLTNKQIQFASRMLGGPEPYRGRAMIPIHRPFQIRKPHFGRRQILLREVLVELELEPRLIDEWLRLEDQLKPLIINS